MSRKAAWDVPEWAIKVVQFAGLPFYYTTSVVFVGRKNVRLGVEDLDDSVNYVFAANHVGIPDPFVILASLNISIHRRLMPYRAFILNGFFYPPLRYGLRLLGGFPAHKHKKLKSGLEVAYYAMEQGQTVVIFPEGRIDRKKVRKYKPKRGVSVLSKRENVLLVPVHLHWDRKRMIFRSYSVAVGKPFDGSKMSAQEIMDVVYSLKFE